MFERAPVGIALIAPGGRFELVNETLAEFLGRDREELEGMLVEAVTHPEDEPESAETMRRLAAGELDEWNMEKRYLRPDGETRWGVLRALILRDADGRRTHRLALIRDITEQRLAERRRAAAHGVLSVMAGGGDLRDALPALLQTVVEELGWERGSLWVPRAGSRRSRPPGPAAAPPSGRRGGSRSRS